MGSGAGIRSLLFVPGDNERLILKAYASTADAVIIDLEDAVAPDRKEAARMVTVEALRAPERGAKPVVVRVNAFDTGTTAADLAAVMPGAPWAIMLPKWQAQADTVRLGHYLDALEAANGVAQGATRILTIATETAAAVLALSQTVAPAHPRLWGMLWGGEDLAATLGASGNRETDGSYTAPFCYARQQCLYAANALGVVAIDAVHTEFRDLGPVEVEATLSQRDGFTAKAAIHPAQAEVINRVLTPSEAQLAWSRQVVELLAERAVALLDGKMIDIAHLRIARRLLQRSAAISGESA